MINFKAGEIFMKQDKRYVTIKLDTTIEDEGEIEYNTIKQMGQFFNKGKLDVLIYEEEHEDGATIKNLITIHPNKVNIKRSGLITMNQQFILNKSTETYYEHPHGQLHMETHTDSITYKSIATDQVQLRIVYRVKINGMEERKHVLELTYKENAK